MMIIETKLVNIRVNPDKWDTFKKLARINNSDASKLLREYIDNYIKKHKNVNN
jgi:hypothetical protein